MEGLEEKLKDLGVTLEGKSKDQIELAIKAFGKTFEEKFEKDVDEKAKAVFKDSIEAFELKLKEQFIKEIKVVQDHADKLDARLKKKAQIIENQTKSFDQALAEQFEEKTDDIEKFLRKEQGRVELDLKAVGDMSTGNVTGGNRYGQLFAPSIIELPKRKVHMRELLVGGSIGPGNSFTFMKQNGRGEGNPAAVNEGALKPQFDMDLVEASVDVQNIAGWMRVTNKALRNIPGFLSFLQSRIPERFERVMDTHILYGDGVSPNLKGILTAGNFTASTSTLADKLIEKLIHDISFLEDDKERDADQIVLRPAAYYSFFKNKADGSGEYDLPMGVTFEGGVLRLFGIPMRPSTAITGTDYIVGNFAQGAQILTQEAMKIEFFREDGINVRENKVTVRVEGDFALPVYGDDYFIKGTTAQA